MDSISLPVKIGFDDLPNNTVVADQYYNSYGVRFYSGSFFYPVHTYQQCGFCSTTSAPNFISTKPDDYGQVTVEFTQSVSNLSFYFIGLDTLSGPFGRVDVYRNGAYSSTYILNGVFNSTAGFTLGPTTNITKIVIYGLTDPAGVGFDDFTFTVDSDVRITNARVNGILNGTTQNALLGADIALNASVVPAGFAGGTYSWTFTGPYSVSGGSTSSSAVTIRSTNSGTITATANYTKNGQTASASVTINVVLPTLVSFTGQRGSDRIAPPYVCSSTDFFWRYILGCGSNVGMSFSARVQAPDTFISNPAQSGIKYVQAVSVFRKRVRAGNLECLTRRGNESIADSNSWMLDSNDPYGRFFPEYPPHYFSEGNLLTMPTVDYPREALTFIQDKEFEDTVIVDDQFHMYVFYFNGTDASSPSIQRPLGVLSWNWGGFVVFDPPGTHVIRSSSSAPSPFSGGGTTSTVTLNGNVKDLPWVLCPNATASTSHIDGSRRFVRQHYLDFLHRDPAGDASHAPDPDGWNYWTAGITQCAFDFNCIRARRLSTSLAFFYAAEFMSSDPIMANPPGSPGFDAPTYNRRFVYYCYRNYLDREPESGGWDFWTNVLNQTSDYHGVVNEFITSNEYRNVRFPI